MLLPPPGSTPFPYTTLFRSRQCGERSLDGQRRHAARAHQRSPVRPPAGRLADCAAIARQRAVRPAGEDRKSTRLNSSHTVISYAVFCLKKKKTKEVKIAQMH